MIKVPAVGPQPADILLVGEAPGKSEEEHVKPFVGNSGGELTKMLNEAGILRTECRVTNVCKYRPPGNKIDYWFPEKKKNIQPHFVKVFDRFVDPRIAEGVEELRLEIEATKPKVIVPLGNVPLWALTGNVGITKWRSSLLTTREGFPHAKVIPTIHPAAILRKWDWRFLAVHDLRRVAAHRSSYNYEFPARNFIVNPSYEVVVSTLQTLLLRLHQGECRLAVDIETTRRHLACIGIAWSKSDAMCIPLVSMAKPEGYFSLAEETSIVLLLREVLTHPNARCIGQNWQYDYQYIAKFWGFEVNLWLDIMSEHHVQFPGLPKGLDFQSSLYLEHHVYWKDEGKEMGKGDELTWWKYNCQDCVATYEIAEVLIANRNVRPLRGTSYGTPNDIQQKLSAPIARATRRGVKLNHELRRSMAFMLQENLREAESWINEVVGFPINCRSPQQLQRLFYEDFRQPKILNRKTKRPTTDEKALETIAKRTLALRPLCQAINHVRSLSNSIAVCLQPTDMDGRFRCQYTIPGTETFRFASSSDPFGYGTNAQNLTSGKEKDKDFPLPNLRKLLIPDSGFIMGEFDLPQADARVVAWEAEDEGLIEIFLDPSRDLHSENCEVIFGKPPRNKEDINRYYAKQGVHLTNYGGNSRVLAMALGITVHEADHFQSRWFQVHPNIKKWHNQVLHQLVTRRYVENIFGYRRFYFDRIEEVLKEALAWIPQSTVAIVTNLGIIAATEDEELSRENLQLLLQTHDSSNFQWPMLSSNKILPRLREKLTITVPYPKPLLFQPGVKLSDKSWGECVDVKDIK